MSFEGTGFRVLGSSYVYVRGPKRPHINSRAGVDQIYGAFWGLYYTMFLKGLRNQGAPNLENYPDYPYAFGERKQPKTPEPEALKIRNCFIFQYSSGKLG